MYSTLKVEGQERLRIYSFLGNETIKKLEQAKKPPQKYKIKGSCLKISSRCMD